jgi:hypothetical protein
MNRRYRLYSILLINIILMSACVRLFPPEPSYIKGVVTNHQQRLYTVSGISFLPPAPPPPSQKPWEVVKRFAEGTKTEFYAYRFRAYIPQSRQGRCCFIRVNLDEETSKIAADIATTDMDELLARSHRGIEAKRLKREELLRGTLEERWQEALQADPDLVAKTAKKMKTRDEKKKKWVPVRRYNKEKQSEIVERSFKYHLGRKRDLHRHLPPDTTQIITSNGKRCLSNGHYQGLPTILAKEYATPTSGGGELNYAIFCPIGSDRVFTIHLFTKIPPGKAFDPYPIIEPIINSIDWAGH